ncbi:MAG: insulinase family protein [Armatimonadetes bacterium]|nr:insulinase family protein [Armatimonadota bacterium]
MHAFLFALVLAQPVPATAQHVTFDKFKLPNGMTVILQPDHSLPIVAVNTWFRVGSKDEPERRSGFAHLFEHLMFMGTKRVPNGAFDTTMEEYGGANNASTWEDITNYFDWGPASLLPVLLWLEADRLEALADEMTLEKLNLQREVVKNERREGVDNAPYGRAYEAINGLMFPKGHPYSTSVIGSMEDLNAATVQDVQDFFRTYYIPNNASLVVVGDFDPKETKARIQSLFGTLPRRSDIVRKPVPPAALQGVRRVTMVDKVSSSKTISVWHSHRSFTPADIAFRLGAGVLGDGAGSRLYQAVVVKKQLASDVSVRQESRVLGSLFTVDATARDDVSLDKLEKAIDEEMMRFLKNGPTQAEVDRQKAKYRFRLVNSMQSFLQRADAMNQYEFVFGNPDGFAKELAMVDGVSPASMKANFKLLNLDKRLVLRVIPELETPEQNPRDTRPEMAPTKSFAFPIPATFDLPNGNKVYYWQKKGVPVTTVSLRFSGGAAADAAGKAGLTGLMADMLTEGAGTRDSEAFANALDAIGASLGASADQKGLTASLTVGTDKLDAGLALMSDAVLRPRFAKGDWERVKAVHLQGLDEADDNPTAVAGKVAAREFFGPNHPYSRPTSGSKESVSTLTLADVKAAYGSRIKSGSANWYAAGNLSPEAFKKALASRFGGWQTQGIHKAVELGNPAPQASRLLIVDRPGAVQTAITVLLPNAAFASPDRPAMQELGIVLGGTFTSRLNRNLREDKGYTYGIGFRAMFSSDVSYSRLATAVRADVTGASLKEILTEIAKIRSGDVVEAEANKARSQFQYDAVTDAETLQGLVNAGIGYLENGIPMSGVAAELARFGRVAVGDLNRVARAAVPWENAVIVLVGDQKEIVKQIEGLDLPKPEIVKP